MPELPRIHHNARTGSEAFHEGDRLLTFTVQDFWQWSVSDLVSNATRGILAEFIVAKAMGIDPNTVRNEWDAYDLTSESGVKIEVKSAAFVQSWYQRDYSKINFSIKPARAWNPATNRLADEATRSSDIYVFALLAHRQQETLDPLDLSQWEFYVVPRVTLDLRNRSQHSITLGSLKKLCPNPVWFSNLGSAIERAI